MVHLLKKILFSSLAIVSFYFSLSASAEVRKFEVSSFKEIAQIVSGNVDRTDKVLSVIDFDDTCGYYDFELASKLQLIHPDAVNGLKLLGTDRGFGLVSGYLKTIGVKDPLKLMYGAVAAAHSTLSPVFTLTDESIHETLDLLLDIGLSFVLTSRSWPLIHTTNNQLASSNLNFTKTLQFGLQWVNNPILSPISFVVPILIKEPWNAYLTPNGVCHCSGNNKGVVLHELIKQFADIKTTIDTIIAVDNDPNHLSRIENELTKVPQVKKIILLRYYNGKIETQEIELSPGTTLAWLNLVATLENPTHGPEVCITRPTLSQPKPSCIIVQRSFSCPIKTQV